MKIEELSIGNNYMKIKIILIIILIFGIIQGCLFNNNNENDFSSTTLKINKYEVYTYIENNKSFIKIDTYLENNSSNILKGIEIYATAYDYDNQIIGTGYEGKYFTIINGEYTWADDFVEPNKLRNKTLKIELSTEKYVYNVHSIELKLSCNKGVGTDCTISFKEKNQEYDVNLSIKGTLAPYYISLYDKLTVSGEIYNSGTNDATMVVLDLIARNSQSTYMDKVTTYIGTVESENSKGFQITFPNEVFSKYTHPASFCDYEINCFEKGPFKGSVIIK